MTAPAIAAPANTAPQASPAPTGQESAVTPITEAPKRSLPQSDTGESFADRIARIGRKASPGQEAYASQPAAQESHPASQGSVLDRQPEAVVTPPSDSPAPTGDSVATVEGQATATPPALVPKIDLDDADATMAMRARDPNTGQFSEMDQSRIYELSIKDKQTGEERIYQKTLPDLMRLAKQGVHMQRAAGELNHYRQEFPKVQEQFTRMTGELTAAQTKAQQLEQLAVELLTAPAELVDQRRYAYAQQFTPEAENERLRQALRERQNTPAFNAPPAAQPQVQPQQDPQIQQLVGAFKQRIAPILAEVESTVGREQAVGQMALFTLPLLVGGQIPPHRLGEVEAYIQGPYREWAKSVAASRTTAAQELATARQVQARAQAAANNVGSATRPVGGVASNAPVAQPPARNREDLINRISRGQGSASGAGVR